MSIAVDKPLGHSLDTLDLLTLMRDKRNRLRELLLPFDGNWLWKGRSEVEGNGQGE